MAPRNLSKFYKLDGRTRQEDIKKNGCIVNQPDFSIINVRQMQMDLSLGRQEMPQLNLYHLSEYCLANLEPPHLGAFESIAFMEDKIQKFIV